VLHSALSPELGFDAVHLCCFTTTAALFVPGRPIHQVYPSTRSPIDPAKSTKRPANHPKTSKAFELHPKQ
jgi:hypothetical protein